MNARILASSCAYRQNLLRRPGLSFTSKRPYPDDEAALASETAAALVERISGAKAQAIRNLYPDIPAIDSDQVAALANPKLGKPAQKKLPTSNCRYASGGNSFCIMACAL